MLPEQSFFDHSPCDPDRVPFTTDLKFEQVILPFKNDCQPLQLILLLTRMLQEGVAHDP